MYIFIIYILSANLIDSFHIKSNLSRRQKITSSHFIKENKITQDILLEWSKNMKFKDNDNGCYLYLLTERKLRLYLKTAEEWLFSNLRPIFLCAQYLLEVNTVRFIRNFILGVPKNLNQQNKFNNGNYSATFQALLIIVHLYSVTTL